MVKLAALTDPDLVPQAVATDLGLKEELNRSLTQTLTAHLKSRHVLLLLDNAEHLLVACAQLADAVLPQCARITILTTSREALGLAGELTYRVPSLSMPDPKRDATPEGLLKYESAQLFIERALFRMPHFAVTRENAPALASVCYRLDGIPLAIELAAARMRAMSLEELNQGLAHRFRLLTGGSRTALPRQQTLRSAIEWSYDLLNDAEKALLCRVSVFSGGWTLEAAEEVCAGEGIDEDRVLDLLTSLVDKSLIVTEERNGGTRYRLLETVRQYAQDRLRESGEETRWQEQHLTHFLALVEEAEPQLAGADQLAWLDRLETEHDNLRSALAWSSATGGNVTGGIHLAGALWRFWNVRGYFAEGRGWLGGLLGAASGGQVAARAKALHAAGVMARQQGDYPVARTLHEESLTLSRELDDHRGVVSSMISLGNVAYDQGDYPAARALYEETLAMARGLVDRWGVAALLNNLGNVVRDQGDSVSARALYEECLAIARERADRGGIAAALTKLGDVACDQGDYPAARALQEEALAIRQELGDRSGIAESMEGLAYVRFSLAGPGRAAHLWGAVERLREEIGAPLPPRSRPRHDRQVAAARLALGDDAAFGLAWQEGRAMTLEQAIEYALEKT
jgi:non-specific serine/threonine protein kinase